MVVTQSPNVKQVHKLEFTGFQDRGLSTNQESICDCINAGGEWNVNWKSVVWSIESSCSLFSIHPSKRTLDSDACRDMMPKVV